MARENLSPWQRADILSAWCKERGRLPKQSEREIYKHYKYLKKNSPFLLDTLDLMRYKLSSPKEIVKQIVHRIRKESE